MSSRRGARLTLERFGGILIVTLVGCGPTGEPIGETGEATLASEADPGIQSTHADRATVAVPLVPAAPTVPAVTVATEPAVASDLQAELAACRARLTESAEVYEARIASLEAELHAATRERVEREGEWLVYTQAISELGAIADVPVASFPIKTGGEGDVPRSDGAVAGSAAGSPQSALVAEAPVAAPIPDRAARSHEIHVALRSLFAVEQVSGLDLLESGTLHPAEIGQPEATGAIGPVVLRVLDERGRPIGSLCAERLRFECSRAARTLTLVLERGYERRSGERFPFSGRGTGGDERDELDPREGERRIVLPDIDPAPWVEAFPELFGPEAMAATLDDGRWDLRALRAALNDVLRVDVAAGYYRLQGLGGVQGASLRDVRLDRLDREGRLECRLFADRMTISLGEQGVQILLEDGAQVRGDQKSAFPDGRHRIFLPRADKRAWTQAGIPGVSEPRER